MDKIFHAHRKQNRAEITVLILDKIDLKIDLKLKTVKKRPKSHYIIIKESIHHEDITIINMHTPKIRAPTYIKQTPT